MYSYMDSTTVIVILKCVKVLSNTKKELLAHNSNSKFMLMQSSVYTTINESTLSQQHIAQILRCHTNKYLMQAT